MVVEEAEKVVARRLWNCEAKKTVRFAEMVKKGFVEEERTWVREVTIYPIRALRAHEFRYFFVET